MRRTKSLYVLMGTKGVGKVGKIGFARLDDIKKFETFPE